MASTVDPDSRDHNLHNLFRPICANTVANTDTGPAPFLLVNGQWYGI